MVGSFKETSIGRLVTEQEGKSRKQLQESRPPLLNVGGERKEKGGRVEGRKESHEQHPGYFRAFLQAGQATSLGVS